MLTEIYKTGKTLMDSSFCKVIWTDTENILFVIWKKNTATMQTEQFKEHLLAFADFVNQYNVPKIFVDTIQCYFTIGLNLQEWHDQHIVPRYLRAGLRKMAFLNSLDLYSQLSHEQSFQEQNSMELSVRFFDDAQKALHWLSQG